ncbi:MAG: Ig-like domain repeat protein [Acidobacteriaceae bacterium]
MCLLACFAPLLSAQTYTVPGTTAVGASSSPQIVSITAQQAGTVATVKVVTQGSTGLDFTDVGGNCKESVLSIGSPCLETITFTPIAPGVRYGAVVLLDSSNNVLGTELIHATATGSLGLLIPGIMSTAAGDGFWLYNGDGIAATSANIYLPSGVVVDAAGNLYLSDPGNQRIRKVDAVSNKISTIAGDGSAGVTGDGGLAIYANLNTPAGLAIDGAGNLYIADSNNHAIRRVDANTGIITTVAGTIGHPGYSGDGGAATSAELNTPEGVAFDNNGDLYIADTGNNRIREVDATTGNISTVAGTGTAGFSGDGGAATSAQLNAPWDVTVSAAGDLYIADQNNNRIRMVAASNGNISTVAGSGATPGSNGDNGPATAAQLNIPENVALDPAGNLYIADAGNNRVRKVNAATGIITTIAGNGNSSASGDGGPATQAGLYGPDALSLDGNGNLYISDLFHHRIRKVSSNTAFLRYADIREGNTSPAQSQTFENDGNDALTISQIQPVSNSALGQGTNACAASTVISAASTCTIFAEFAPTTTGNPITGTISVTSNAVNNTPSSPATITLLGNSLKLDPTTTVLNSSKSPSTTGSSIILTAVVTVTPPGINIPSGKVQFYDNGTTLLGTVPGPTSTNATNVSATYTLPLTSLTAGTYSITAVFAGDTYDNTSTSAPISQLVQDSTSLLLTSSLNPSTLNQAVTFTATLTDAAGGTPTGNIVFYDGNTVISPVPLTGTFVETLTLTNLPVGTHNIKAVYAGDATTLGSTSPVVAQLVTPDATSTTVLTASANPSNAGAMLTLTATVTPSTTGGTLSGTVTYKDGATSIGPVALSAAGTAVLNIKTLLVGTHTITADYSGNDSYAGSSSKPLSEVIQQATAAALLTSSGSPSTAGKPVTFTVTVTSNGGTPTGTIVFEDNGQPISNAITLNGSGSATYITSTLAVATHSITAVYAGDANDTSATSNAVSLVVDKAAPTTVLASSQNSILTLVPITFTVTVNSGTSVTPTGTVTLSDGSSTIGTATLASGKATIPVQSLSAGQHSIIATYSGDTQDLTSTSQPFTETVQLRPTTDSLSTSTTSASSNQQITLISVVQGTGPVMPTGTVVFQTGTTTLGSGTLNSNGVATYTFTPSTGNYNIVSTYQGDAVYAASTSTTTAVTVGQATDFTLGLSTNSVKLQSKQNYQVKLTLTSLKQFADTVSLGCAGLPIDATCTFTKDQVALAADSTQTVTVTIDTGSPLTAGGTAHNDHIPHNGIAFAFLPGALLAGFLLRRSKTLKQTLGSLMMILLFCGTIALSGCGTIKVNGTPPGSYVVDITAVGNKTGATQSAAITLTVTQ